MSSYIVCSPLLVHLFNFEDVSCHFCVRVSGCLAACHWVFYECIFMCNCVHLFCSPVLSHTACFTGCVRSCVGGYAVPVQYILARGGVCLSDPISLVPVTLSA